MKNVRYLAHLEHNIGAMDSLHAACCDLREQRAEFIERVAECLAIIRSWKETALNNEELPF